MTTGLSIIKIKYKSIKYACLNECLLAFFLLSCLRSSKRKARVRTGKLTPNEKMEKEERKKKRKKERKKESKEVRKKERK